MLDMKFIRENPELVKNAIINKNEKIDLKKVLDLDKKKRELQFKFDTMRAEQNNVSKQIPEFKKAKKDTTEIVAQMRMISNQIKEISEKLLQGSWISPLNGKPHLINGVESVSCLVLKLNIDPNSYLMRKN